MGGMGAIWDNVHCADVIRGNYPVLDKILKGRVEEEDIQWRDRKYSITSHVMYVWADYAAVD